MAVGDLLIGWLLLRQAEIAIAALDGDCLGTKSLLPRQGRGSTFFAKNVLPD